MITGEQARDLIGSTAYDDNGAKVGKIGHVYFDDQIGRPEWVTASTGMLSGKESFIPVDGASLSDGSLTVSFSKDTIKQAPQVTDENESHISEQQETELYRFYGMTRDTDRAGTPPKQQGDERHSTGHDTSGPTTDEAMTRSEEQLHVGTERRERGRARLRKYVVTEEQEVRVPVSHEEVYVEREPVTEQNRDAATDGPVISEEEHELTLHEERPVVAKETTPVERVRMGKDTVREEETVQDEVRKEHIDAEGVEDSGRHGPA